MGATLISKSLAEAFSAKPLGGGVSLTATAVLFTTILLCVPASAQSRAMEAKRVADGAIEVDGTPGEAEWRTADPATDFVQAVPETGQPSTERTEVRILYDDRNLYIGAWCYTADPKTIRYFEYYRDFAPLNTDTFEVAIDTYHDQRNSFVFVTNPLGAKLDIEFSNNGGTANMNWDAVWHVETTITKEGFFIEIAIPFRSLKYLRDASDLTWGINFQRRIRHRNEQSYWSLVPRPFSVPRVSLAGVLTGLTDLPHARNLKVTPFGVGGFKQTPSASPAATGASVEHSTKGEWDAGVDAKWGLTNNLTLDMTLNPDFSNVEVDVEQVNLTRFGLFFPERRPFFLENSTIFDIRRSRRGNGISSSGLDPIDLIPFFSRTIGLSEDRRPVPVIGGARLTGRVEGGLDIGVLNIHTSEFGESPGESFSVGRFRKKVLENSEIGFLVTDRQSHDGTTYNRLLGTDLHFQLWKYLDLSGLFMATDDHAEEDGQAWSVAASWRDSFWDWDAGYLSITDDFRPGMGFVPRRGIGKYTQGFAVHPRLDRFGIREYSPLIRNDYIVDSEGDLATKLLSAGAELIFRDGATFSLLQDRYFERLKEPFFIGKGVEIPEGDYTFNNWTAMYMSDDSRRLSGTLGIERGGFFAGTKKTYLAGVAVRPNHHWQAGVDYSRNYVKQPTGNFTTDLVGFRFDYGFSPTMFFNAFVQYNSFDDQFSTNFRFNIIHRPLSNLYITYNEVRATIFPREIDRILAIKYTHLIQF